MQNHRWNVCFKFALFIVSFFYQINLSLLFFSLFVLFGAFGKAKENKYIKLYTALSSERLARGMPYKKQAIEKNVTVKKLMSMLDENAVNEVVVFSGEKEVTVLKQNRIGQIIESGDLYSPIAKYI